MKTTYEPINLLELYPFNLEVFDIDDLLGFLGENAEQDFDVDAIEDEVTFTDYHTMRQCWKPFFATDDEAVNAERLNRVAFEHLR